MKRILLLLMLFLLLISLTVTVFAASNTYDLDELELQIAVPTDYSVITRDTPVNDPIFKRLGTTKTEVIDHFEAGDIYLNVISDIYNEEIVVTMLENNLNNLSLLSDTTLDMLASFLVDQYINYGINVSKYEIYQRTQVKFVKLYFTDTAKTVHGLQYYTIYDGKALNFTMRSYEGSLSSRQETVIKNIVDSIQYDKVPPVFEPGEDADSFIHTDTETGVTFMVPENWKQEAFTKDREFIDVKFASTKDEGCIMIYGSTDMWGKMSAIDRVGYSRADLNNAAFTKEDIAEMYSTTADKITTVTYNSVQYFKGETKYTSDIYGIELSVTMTQLVYIDNGWLYTFQFGGPSTHKLYSDFESLLKSVQYPSASNEAGVGSDSKTLNKYNNDANDNSGIIAVVAVLTVVALITVAIVVSHRKRNTKITCISAYTPHTPRPESVPEPRHTCKNCGHALPLDSAFCHVCGTEIEKES